jgi:hypothetical protein
MGRHCPSVRRCIQRDRHAHLLKERGIRARVINLRSLRRLDLGDIAAKLGRAGPASVAPTRGRMIEKGLIYNPSYGLTEFAVPTSRSSSNGALGPCPKHQSLQSPCNDRLF